MRGIKKGLQRSCLQFASSCRELNQNVIEESLSSIYIEFELHGNAMCCGKLTLHIILNPPSHGVIFHDDNSCNSIVKIIANFKC